MTKEQEEAIERMYDLIHTCEVGIEKHGEYDDLFKLDKEAIETVLSMLQEQQEEKDKIIELAVEIISNLETDIPTIREQFRREYCEFINNDEDFCYKQDEECKNCIREYLKRKVEKE